MNHRVAVDQHLREAAHIVQLTAPRTGALAQHRLGRCGRAGRGDELVPFGTQALKQMAAHEAGAAGEEDLHSAHPEVVYSIATI